jgi:hypothetical protein
MIDEDRDLRGRFAALRAEEAVQAPECAVFRHPITARRTAKPSIGLIAASALLAAIVAAIVASHPPRRTPDRPVASIAEWKSPTDFLLDTPGRDLLQTVPTIGIWPGNPDIPRPRHKHPHRTTQNSH